MSLRFHNRSRDCFGKMHEAGFAQLDGATMSGKTAMKLFHGLITRIFKGAVTVSFLLLC